MLQDITIYYHPPSSILKIQIPAYAQYFCLIFPKMRFVAAPYPHLRRGGKLHLVRITNASYTMRRQIDTCLYACIS